MTSVLWTPETREYARQLLCEAERHGVVCNSVFVDGKRFRLEAEGEMPKRFRAAFKKYSCGISEILINRGSIRHEVSGGKWATDAANAKPYRSGNMAEWAFEFQDFEAEKKASRVAAKLARETSERVLDFVEHAKAAGVSLTVVSQPGQPPRLVGSGRNSKAHTDGFYARLGKEGDAIAAILIASPHRDVPVVTSL